MRIAERILLKSLPTLGIVDVGGADVRAAGNGELTSLALRFTSRGRRLVAGQAPSPGDDPSEFVEARDLRIGTSAKVADVVGLGRFVELGSIEDGLHVSLSSAAISKGLSAGIQAAEMQQRIAAVADLPDDLETALEQAGTVLGRATFTLVGGFLWVEDEEIRQMLATTPGTRELFVDPSPPSGLLVSATVDTERLVRRCRAIGVDIDVEESAARVRRSSRPPPKTSTTRRSVSWRPPPTKKNSGGTS
jgi:hypothetical protein